MFCDTIAESSLKVPRDMKSIAAGPLENRKQPIKKRGVKTLRLLIWDAKSGSYQISGSNLCKFRAPNLSARAPCAAKTCAVCPVFVQVVAVGSRSKQMSKGP